MPFDVPVGLVILIVLCILGFSLYARRRAPGRRYNTKLHVLSRSSATLVGDSDWHSLTQREKQVARRVVAGESNKQVAEVLGIRPQTVSAHLKNIYTKMGVQSRMQLAARLRDVDD